MAKTTWFVAAIVGAALVGCAGSGGGSGGSPGGKFSERTCAKGETPCNLQASREWVFIFPKAAVDYEKLILEKGNPGLVRWTIPDSDFYFQDDAITLGDDGKAAFKCGLVSPVDGKSQQYECSLTHPPATGEGYSYKYTIKIHYRGWYFVWGHDPWMVN
jgi:hypothetical protein